MVAEVDRLVRADAWDSSSRTARFFSDMLCSMARPPSTMAKKAAPTASTSQISDIDIHDLPHPEDPEHQQDDRDADHEQTHAWS